MSRLYSIKCTNCAAPLQLMGGGRVQTITCSYCKSVIDLNDEYKVLSSFREYKENYKLPFEIGMRGIVESVEYTIIGRVTYREIEPPFAEWSDFLLFSPLYGYAWITYEEGHLLFSKRSRAFPNIEWKDISQKHLHRVEEEEYEPLCSYTAKIIYVEGELTWVAKKGDRTSFIDLISPPLAISAERSKDEIEFYKVKYLEASALYDAFNVEKERQIISDEFHPLKPLERPFFETLSKISLWVMLVVALLFVTVTIDGRGDVLERFPVNNYQKWSKNFNVNSDKYLTSIELKASKSKDLNNFTIKVYRDETLIFSANKNSVYRLEKSSKLSRWDKKAKRVIVYLKLEKGDYKFTGEALDKTIVSSINVTIRAKSSRTNYIVIFFLFTSMGYLIYIYFKWRYRRQLNGERNIYLFSSDSFDRYS